MAAGLQRRQYEIMLDVVLMQTEADVYRTLVPPGVYRSLVTERGWAPSRCEQWLGDALIRECLS